MTTIFEQMKTVLRDSGRFTEEQITQLFSDAYTGRHIRYDYEDDEEEDEDEENNQIEEKPLKKFRVLHPVNGALNTLCERGKYEYEEIWTILTTDIARVFILTQNDLNEDYAALCRRSTSVGDIIIDESADAQEYPLGRHYIVMGMGFEEIPATFSNYIDWTNHVD